MNYTVKVGSKPIVTSRTVTFSFPGIFSADNVLTLDTPRLFGEAWESQESIILTWHYKDQGSPRIAVVVTTSSGVSEVMSVVG